MSAGNAFAGQLGLITGAGSGIGRAIAASFAASGGTPCLVGRNLKKLEAVADLVRGAAPGVSVRSCDLGESTEIRRLVESVHGLGRLDLLVHCAGAWLAAPFEQTTSEMLDASFRVNVRAPHELTRLLLPRLQASQGQIVFVNSSAAVQAGANLFAYGAMKRALGGMADHLRAEVNAKGIRVLSVFPGRTATPLQARIQQEEGRTYEPSRLLQPEDVAAMVIQALALPRTAEVTDIHIRPMHK